MKRGTIVITGASSGIGAATAVALARGGVKLALCARRVEKLEAVAGQCRAAGAEVLAVPCDVSQREQVKQLIDLTVEKFGRLDVVIANAGFGIRAKVHTMTGQQVEDIYRTNVLGTWYCMVEAIPRMLGQAADAEAPACAARGHVIAVSSGAGRIGLPDFGWYSVTKSAQLMLAQASRVELSGTGVYVSTVHPVGTDTEFFETAAAISGTKVKHLGRVQSAELVARKIVRLIEKPKPEVWPMPLAQFGLALAAMFPRLGDFVMRKQFPQRDK